MEKRDKFSEFEGGNISIIVSGYNDLFSSFDPRPTVERALSDDFIVECRRASADREEPITLRILVPHSKRSLKEEGNITFRLKDHFRKHFASKSRELRNLRLQGIVWFCVGTLAMSLAAFIHESSDFFLNLLKTMLEPAGWFFFWEGLYKAVIIAKEKMPYYTFYKKMNSMRVLFSSY